MKLKRRLKKQLRQAIKLKKKGLLPVLHMIEVRIVINSHDDNSPMPNAAPPGPMIAHKEISFGGFGRNLSEAVAEVQQNVNAFLESDALEIGSRERRILSPHRPS